MGYLSSEGEALAYITDCNLATVSHLALKKSRPKGEYARQIAIAQKALDVMIRFGTDLGATRAVDVVREHNGSVETWAKSFEAK